MVVILPTILTGTDFCIDYGIWGVLVPVFAYIGKNKCLHISFAAIPLTALAASHGGIQWFSLAALLLLVFYSGKRGKWKMKNLFYIYYPLHLVVIYAIRLII